MAKLPEVDRAVIDQRKIVDYLLNAGHPDNGGKAAAFVAFGFDRQRPDVLAHALRDHARTHDVRSVVQRPRGTKFIIRGTLDNPTGRRFVAQVVWQIDPGKSHPRLVSAYPVRQRMA